ncbi:hypothetical protein [Natronorubrum texcoconense]|uniref:RecA-superfamily ATPase, KaiC/GvpD/RAD55 family n=1 Tax=Natronorubrum texcoconense TaxID=1095776 RepID=A0A1G8YCK5_9EURY|nr:hypothetical protein [Natronorubrum texcoconense]SDK00639.1 hypothetical protein SAMN04515672_2115 [Natronorubrum texcoconense]
MDTHTPTLGLEFESGLTLLEVPSPRSTILHRLVGARLTESATEHDPETNATAYWIDARNTAATQVLYDCVSSDRTLESLRVARAFTAYQHHSLVRRVTRQAGPETELIVAPNVASLYHDADLPEWEREGLLAAALETLAELGRVLSCPILVTSADENRADTVAEYAATTLECVRTREGIRLVRSGEEPTDDDGEMGSAIDDTAGYWHGTHWQTTIPYWVDLYGAVAEGQSIVEAYDRGLLEVTA